MLSLLVCACSGDDAPSGGTDDATSGGSGTDSGDGTGTGGTASGTGGSSATTGGSTGGGGTGASGGSSGGSGGSSGGSSGGVNPPVITGVEMVENTDVHPGGSACIEAACPAGKTLLQGGGIWAPDIHPSSARPKDAMTYELCGDATTGGAWTAQAMCGVVSTTSMIVSDQEALTLGAAPCIDVGCPDGFAVVGGGVTWHEPGTPENERSNSGSWGPDSSFNLFSMCGWSGGSHTWIVEAICVEGAEVQTPTVMEMHPATGPDTVECISAGCSAGEVLVGGGGLWTAQVFPERVGLNDAGDMWTVCAAHTDPIEWWATAACVPAG